MNILQRAGNEKVKLKNDYQEFGVSHYYKDIHCLNKVESSVSTLLNALNKPIERPIVYICIGTDKATGDCLGPLVGSRLKTMLPAAHVYGTLQNPLHALNLQPNIEYIYQSFRDPFIIAIDACLGNAERVGFINIKSGGLLPGSALQKKLPYIGDFHISAVVNVADSFHHLVLQNTRLYLVDRMADIIAKSLCIANHRFIHIHRN